MSARTATRPQSRGDGGGTRSSARGRGPTKAQRLARRRRRRAFGFLAAVVLVVLAFTTVSHWADRAVQDGLTLPLRHEDIIRQQARDKDLDPALIAGVIYAESGFRDQTSRVGAKGLMQLMPATAAYIARKSGGTAFVQGDLATPQINIAYGAWYLRYLLDHYAGKTVLALAAYNAGEGKVDEWYAGARARGETFRVASHVPFPETRAYVTRVLAARRDYRREYRSELGLS
jgi:soluble lytic murein transglycosylase